MPNSALNTSLDISKIRRLTRQNKLRLDKEKSVTDKNQTDWRNREAKKGAKKVLSESKAKIEHAASAGRNSTSVFRYDDQNKVDFSTAKIVEESFKKRGFAVNHHVDEGECNVYFGTDVVISW